MTACFQARYDFPQTFSSGAVAFEAGSVAPHGSVSQPRGARF